MHQAYHIGDKKFTCTLCGQKYYKTSHLKRHVQHVHMKLRLWKCGKYFKFIKYKDSHNLIKLNFDFRILYVRFCKKRNISHTHTKPPQRVECR